MQTDANTTATSRKGSWARRNLHTMALMGASAILLAATMSFPHVAHSLTSGVSGIPPVQLATTPLYAAGARAKPTLTLALSVEFPTVGAQYLGGTYSPSTTYIGYFDAGSCYTYNNHNSADYRRFDRSGSASGQHACGGTGFSGNFLNWATSSAIDILRFALTGGDRIVDDTNLTVLQRAVLPTDQGGFWNSNNFPAKTLPKAVAANAVPSSLIGTYTGDIKIANCLNRVHFGTESTGNCTDPGNNSNLGVAGNSGQKSALTDSTTKFNFNGYSKCADENGTCSFSGIKRVAYGVNDMGNPKKHGWVFFYAKDGIACTNSAIGKDPFSGYGKACYIADDDGGWTPTGASNNTAVLSSDRFFYTRVRVCEGTNSTTDPRGNEYCQKFNSGYFKPVGHLQKYSDKIRVAAFGYLMQQGQQRYGGVLRAPMRFVGSQHFNNLGEKQTGTNPHLEWNTETGVFKQDPDNASASNVAAITSTNSGVINYLNKFGRTGSSIKYKNTDPVGELYYESLRYIQGLQPTDNAWSGWNEDMRQNFPLYTTWEDPHNGMPSNQNYSCVRNNILTIGDQNVHVDKSVPGNNLWSNEYEFHRTANPAVNEPNFITWTNKVGELDGKGNLGSKTYNEGATSPGYHMAGIAYWAHTNDIRGSTWTSNNTNAAGEDKRRPGMRVTTYVLDVNENGSQGNSADRRHRSPYFLAAKYGGFIDNAKSGDPASTGNIWAKADQPEEARTYYLVNNAQSIIDGLNEIFATVVAEANTIANSAISSSSLSQGETALIYRGQFDVTDWSGDVVALPLNRIDATAATETTAATTASVAIGSQVWSAASKLATRSTARNIIIGKRNRTEAMNFTWDAIETDLKTSLNATDSLGEDRLAYLRGDRTKEGSVFRTRGKLIGDVVNSGVVFSGAPSNLVADADYYGSTSIYQTKKNRTPAVFAGANDGMLHAFDARNDSTNGGTELFAYIPSWIGSKLTALTDKNYNADGHQSYVDATPAVAEAKVGTTWKTVLVGGTGAGGQGVYALDVSDPANFTKDNVMWEFTDEDDAGLGNVVGEPHILKVQTGTNAYKWFAVVASGVNNYVSDDGRASNTGKPTLFFLDLSKAYDSSWTEGTNYFKVELPVSTTLDMASGIVNFTPVSNSAGVLERIYTGDLQGNLWRLVFKGRNISTGPTGNETPLFIATDSTLAGNRQPISAAPILFRADDQNIAVTFGTGKYLEETDNSNIQPQSFYAILDGQKPSSSATDDGSDGSLVAKTRLKSGTVDTITRTVTVAPPFNWATIYQITQNAALASSLRRSNLYAGWYFDLPVSGERQISDGIVYGDYVLINSLVPPSANQGICGTGESNSYIVDVATGEAVYEASTVGLLSKPLVIDVDEEYSVLNSVGQRVKTITSRIIQQGSGGSAPGSEITRTLLTGRLNWRQIMNYEELRSKDYDGFVPASSNP